MAHRVHRVMRLVAVDRPVAQMIGRELVGAHRAHRNVDGDFGPLRTFGHPAAIGAGHLEVIAMHVDRMVRHGQVAHAHADAVALVDNQRVDIRKDPAVPCPEVEIGHRHDARHIGAGVDVEGVQHDQEIAVHGPEGRVLGMHDEHAHHAHRHLHHLVGMGVIHEGAGFDQVELVDIGLARRDRRMAEAADAVHAGRQDQPVPVDRCVFGQPVGHEDADAVSLDRLDRGAGGLAVIAPQMRDHAFGQFAFHWFGDKVEFLDAVVHPVRQGPAVQRDHGRVIRPRCGARRYLGCGAVHDGGFGQAHIGGLSP